MATATAEGVAAVLRGECPSCGSTVMPTAVGDYLAVGCRAHRAWWHDASLSPDLRLLKDTLAGKGDPGRQVPRVGPPRRD